MWLPSSMSQTELFIFNLQMAVRWKAAPVALSILSLSSFLNTALTFSEVVVNHPWTLSCATKSPPAYLLQSRRLQGSEVANQALSHAVKVLVSDWCGQGACVRHLSTGSIRIQCSIDCHLHPACNSKIYSAWRCSSPKVDLKLLKPSLSPFSCPAFLPPLYIRFLPEDQLFKRNWFPYCASPLE